MTVSRRPRMFLGVDGGGTKTALCLVSAEGDVLARAQTDTAYYMPHSVRRVGAVLRAGVAEVCRRAGITPADVTYAFFGLPSYGEVSGDLAALDGAPRTVLGHDRYACDNDMVCAWAGSLAGQDGINVISGTGSMAYGQRRDRAVRVGGWGELFGDDGSAYWIAVRALNLVSRMSDGRSADGPLHETVRRHLGLDADLDMVDVVLNRWRGGRGQIAGLSRVVADAAQRGDAQAAGILGDAGRELAVLVDVARGRLGFGDGEQVAVSYSGGVFCAEPVLDSFRATLTAAEDGVTLRQPRFTPVIGAAVQAARLAGAPLSPVALRRLDEAGRDWA